MQILKASYSYACNAYLLPTYYIKHRGDHADSSCIAFCTGKTEMPFEFEKYILGIVKKSKGLVGMLQVCYTYVTRMLHVHYTQWHIRTYVSRVRHKKIFNKGQFSDSSAALPIWKALTNV